MSQAAALPPQATALRALGTVRHFAPDQPLFREGDPAGHFMQMITGVVRSFCLLRDGRRYIDAFYADGDVFGMDAGPCQARAAEAVCACSVVFYPRHICEAVPSQQIFAAMMLGLRQAQDHARLLGRASAMEKTAAFLLEWSGRAETWPMITLAMTRADIADYLGMTVETVCRCLAQLNRDGLIQILSARCIKLVDLAALRAMTG